ncbi:MAG: sel1 repeat family protein, partial [Thermoguttaceae bacterium]|nr:sel1 repeat family protein [Thermoguttaceae bacterium]
MEKKIWKRNALQASLTIAAALGMWGAAAIGVEQALANSPDSAVESVESEIANVLDAEQNYAGPYESVPSVEAPSVAPPTASSESKDDCDECGEYCYKLVQEQTFPWRSYYVRVKKEKSEAQKLADYLLEELPRRLDPNWRPTLPSIEPTLEGRKTLSEVLTDLSGENKFEDFASETIEKNYQAGRAQFFGLLGQSCDWSAGVKNLKFAQNSIVAQAELALAYAFATDADLKDWGVERSDIEKLAKEAADKYNNPFAQYALGMYYEKVGNGDVAKTYFDKAKKGLDQAIEECGDPLASTLRGMYYANYGAQQEFDALADLMTAGSALAMYEAGRLAARFGREPLANKYYSESAQDGWTDAELAYAEYCEKAKNWERACYYYGRAAEAKNPQALFKYAFCCEKGPAYGARQDWNKAYEYYEAASKAGHAEATYRLGLMYADTANVRVQAWTQTSAQNRWTEALKCFEEATKAGCATAAYQVGLYYLAQTSEVKYDTVVPTQNPTDPSVPQEQRQADWLEAAKWFEMIVVYKGEQDQEEVDSEKTHVEAAKELLTIYESLKADYEKRRGELAEDNVAERDKLTAQIDGLASKIDKLNTFVMQYGNIELIAAKVVESAQKAVGAKSAYDGMNALLRVAGRVVDGDKTSWTEYDQMGENQKAYVAEALRLAILLTADEAQKDELNGRLLAIAGKDDGANYYVAMDLIAKKDWAEAQKRLEKIFYKFDKEGKKEEKDGKFVLNDAPKAPNVAKARYELALCLTDEERCGKGKADWANAEPLFDAVAKIEIAKDVKDADELAKLQNEAAVKLGKYLLGAEGRSEDGKALLTAAKERNFVPAILALAEAEKDIEKQKELYAEASALGAIEATLKLIELNTDEEEKFKWTKKAAEQGDKESFISALGRYEANQTKENKEAALKLLNLWLGEGDVKGKYELSEEESKKYEELRADIGRWVLTDESTDGEPTDGESTDGESTDGESTDGE